MRSVKSGPELLMPVLYLQSKVLVKCAPSACFLMASKLH
jgi:hypothetical protein